MSPIALIGVIASVLGITGFVIERLFGPVRRLWRWATRQRRLTAALPEGTACEVQLRTFTDAIGQEPTHRSDAALYVLQDVYVDVALDGHENVERFAITTRSAGYAPELYLNDLPVRLGLTTYAEFLKALLRASRLGRGRDEMAMQRRTTLATPARIRAGSSHPMTRVFHRPEGCHRFWRSSNCNRGQARP